MDRVQVDENLADKSRHSGSSFPASVAERARTMAGSPMGKRRNDVGLRSGGEGVVLLQRGDGERYLRKSDPTRDEGTGALAFPVRTQTGKIDTVANLDEEGLTFGEKLLISRRRSEQSQEQAARSLGVSRNVYGKLERDEEVPNRTFPVMVVEELTKEEKCLILRRRAGLTQEECAEEIGVTRFWFNQMETGKVCCQSLANFWGIAA